MTQDDITHIHNIYTSQGTLRPSMRKFIHNIYTSQGTLRPSMRKLKGQLNQTTTCGLLCYKCEDSC